MRLQICGGIYSGIFRSLTSPAVINSAMSYFKVTLATLSDIHIRVCIMSLPTLAKKIFRTRLVSIRSVQGFRRYGITYCTYKYSNAFRTSQTRSFAKWYHILHPQVAFESALFFARCGIKSFYDAILRPSLKQCWITLLFEYSEAIW